MIFQYIKSAHTNPRLSNMYKQSYIAYSAENKGVVTVYTVWFWPRSKKKIVVTKTCPFCCQECLPYSSNYCNSEMQLCL